MAGKRLGDFRRDCALRMRRTYIAVGLEPSANRRENRESRKQAQRSAQRAVFRPQKSRQTGLARPRNYKPSWRRSCGPRRLVLSPLPYPLCPPPSAPASWRWFELRAARIERMTRKKPSMASLLRWVLAGAAAGTVCGVCAMIFLNYPPELRMRTLTFWVVLGIVVAGTLWELLFNRDNLADS
jgi:hypothetical protein